MSNINEKQNREMVYEFMVALASNPQAVDNDSSIQQNADYVLRMAIALAERFETSLVEGISQ
jgi:hypothetical protein